MRRGLGLVNHTPFLLLFFKIVEKFLWTSHRSLCRRGACHPVILAPSCPLSWLLLLLFLPLLLLLFLFLLLLLLLLVVLLLLVLLMLLLLLLSFCHPATGSPQRVWLEQQLQSVNRTQFPWLIVNSHRPLYNSENDMSDFVVR